MAETDAAYTEIRSVRLELEQQGSMLDAMVRYTPDIKKHITDEIQKDPLLVLIFQLVGTGLSQKEIIAELRRRKAAKTSDATVSRRIEKLRADLHVIVGVGFKDGSPMYGYSRLARALSIQRTVGKLDKA